MKKSCYLTCMELTPNDTFVLRVFVYRGFFDTDSFILRIPNCFCIENAEYEIDKWLNTLNLKLAKVEINNFQRKLNSIFYSV